LNTMTASLRAPVARATPLTPEHVDRLRTALVVDLQVQRDHVAALRATADSLRGQADGDSLLERELAERGAVTGLEAIADIQGALARIDAGAYGSCTRCAAPIAAARLEVIPHARLCINCPPAAPRLIG
jgi:DnaK suppressor protein